LLVMITHPHMLNFDDNTIPTPLRMFLWIDCSPIDDTADLVQKEALTLGVLAVPGFAFLPNHGKSSFLRVSFSIVDIENKADLGMKLLAQAIRQRLDILRKEGKIQ